MPRPAPVAYFAFNRPQHTARTLAALAANPLARETDLRIFIDGPRDAGDRAAVDEVVKLAHSASGFRQISIAAAPANLGLYRSLTKGVGQVVSDAGRVIVVEDDVLVWAQFLTYMNDALERYQQRPEVGAIHAYSPPLDALPDYFFLPGADCWGWGTWADRWALFDPDPAHLLRELVARQRLGAFCASHGSRSLLLLARRARGLNQSWAIQWHASLFLADRCTLHPGHSLVQNIGNDGSGAHAARSQMHATTLSDLPLAPLPAKIEIDRAAGARLSRFLDGGNAFTRMALRAYAHAMARLSASRAGSS